MKKNKISSNVIRRLPRYIRQLDRMASYGVVKVSSNEIGRRMGITASQVRQDFNCFGGFGQQGYGYNVTELRQQLADILGMTVSHTAVLIGVGNLGRALVQNFSFHTYGFKLKAAFDIDRDLVGQTICGVKIHHIDELEEYLGEHPTDVAILTLPAKLSGPMAARVAMSGVRGLWNFTNEEITSVGPDMIIENVHFSDSLLALSYYLSEDTDD